MFRNRFVSACAILPLWAGLASAARPTPMPDSGQHFSVVQTVFYSLIALGVSFWVLTVADRQKRPLDVLGRLIGALILAVAFFGLLAALLCFFTIGSQA